MNRFCMLQLQIIKNQAFKVKGVILELNNLKFLENNNAD